MADTLECGFPASTTWDEAVDEVRRTVARTYRAATIVGEPQWVQTPVHEANGEFVVRVSLGGDTRFAEVG